MTPNNQLFAIKAALGWNTVAQIHDGYSELRLPADTVKIVRVKGGEVELWDRLLASDEDHKGKLETLRRMLKDPHVAVAFYSPDD